MSPPADKAAAALEMRATIEVGSRARTFCLETEVTLQRGVAVLFGPSGSGKSLTVQALAGLVRPIRGFVRVQGETLFDGERRVFVEPHRRRVGYVPQHHALFPFLDVEENVAFGLSRRERKRGNPRVLRLLEEHGLAPLRTRRPAALSGGERQRVALARALVVEPRLLLLDEPFASIDQVGKEALRDQLKETLARHQTPAVLVTHDPADARALGDEIVRFEKGRTVEQGRPDVILPRGEGVRIRARLGGTPRSTGEGRVEARLLDVTMEGPERMFSAGEEEELDLELLAGSSGAHREEG